MNCQTARTKIGKQLAAGVSEPPAEVAAHYAVCRECQAYYEMERALFVNIDNGLRSLANQPAPVSLVPSVRARLEDVPVSKPFGLPVWAFAAAALTVVFSVAIFWRHDGARTGVPERVPITSVASGTLASEPGSQPQAPKASAARWKGPKAVVTRNSQAATPEVIVLQEERDAYARFVSRRFQEHAPALLPVSSGSGDTPVEISLLRIKGVEIEPLDSTAEQAR